MVLNNNEWIKLMERDWCVDIDRQWLWNLQIVSLGCVHIEVHIASVFEKDYTSGSQVAGGLRIY